MPEPTSPRLSVSVSFSFSLSLLSLCLSLSLSLPLFLCLYVAVSVTTCLTDSLSIWSRSSATPEQHPQQNVALPTTRTTGATAPSLHEATLREPYLHASPTDTNLLPYTYLCISADSRERTLDIPMTLSISWRILKASKTCMRLLAMKSIGTDPNATTSVIRRMSSK